MRSIQYLNLDINKKTQQTITANVGEVGSRYIKIKMIDNDKPLDLTGVSVFLYALKSDDTKVFSEVEIEDATNGILMANLTSQLMTKSGSVKLTLVLLEQDKKLGSKEFVLNVDESILDDEVVESTNEFSALTTALGKVQGIDNKFANIDEQFNTMVQYNNQEMKNKYDDIVSDGTTITMMANGVIKKSITLSNSGGGGEGHTHTNKSTLDKITEDKLTSWDNKVNSVVGKGLSTNDYTTIEKTKLQGIEDNANNYTHPTVHLPSMIAQDSNNRFVTDIEKLTWNSKSNFSGSYDDLSNKPIIPSEYTLPVATANTLGGIKVGSGLSISNGVLSADSGGDIISSIEPADDDIPRLFLSEGTLPTTKDSTTMKIEYKSKTKSFNGYVDIKCQGTSSMAYPKKNFTIKVYSDINKTTKLKQNFRGWGNQYKFCMKANYIDISHARNVVSAKLWGDCVKSRSNFESLPTELKTSANVGAIDGFFVKVYSNGVYQGRYTMNIPKDSWMCNMDSSLDTHCILCGENYVSGCFRGSANIDGTDWSDELHDVVPTSIKTRWNEVISFVMNSNDTDFKTNLSNYFDVESLINYYCFQYAICGLDSMGKNQLYLTYDGQKWIANSYDMDSTWGLWWTGESFVSSSYTRNEYQDFKDGQGNLLYIRLQNLYTNEIKARYSELRKGALSLTNIINRFEEFMICNSDLVKEDYEIFTGIPSQTTNNLKQIRKYAIDRLAYVDTQISNLTPPIEPIPCTSITLSSNSLTFTNTTSQTLTSTTLPSNTTNSIIWSVSPTGICSVSNGVVIPISNGSCVIAVTCGTQTATCNVSISGLASSEFTPLSSDLAIVNLARIGVSPQRPGHMNYDSHLGITHGEYYGYEWSNFYNNYFELDATNVNTGYMMGLSLPYVSDTDKKTCDYECVAGACVSSVNYLDVKIKNSSITNYLTNNELYVALKTRPYMHSYVIKSSNIAKAEWTEDTGYTTYEYIDNTITNIRGTGSTDVYATNTPLYNNKPVVIGKLTSWNGDVYVRVSVLEQFATSLDSIKQLLTDNTITIRY